MSFSTFIGSVQSLIRVHLFATPDRLQHTKLPCPSPTHIYALCLTPESIWVCCPQISKPQAADCGVNVSPESLFCQAFMGNFHLLKNKVLTQNLKSKLTGIAQMQLIKEKIYIFTFLFSYFLFLELHVIMGLTLDILGSIACGYWCARIIQFILTDLFSNTLTNIIFCISMVYMTFYIGKTETDTKIPSLMYILCF